MIRTFKNRETEKIFKREFSKKYPSDIQNIALRKLRMLNRSINLNDLKVLEKDITEINLLDTFSIVGNVDLVIGGPPCQGFSDAGKKMLDDPRNKLVKYFIDSIEMINPKYFIMENVSLDTCSGTGKE